MAIRKELNEIIGYNPLLLLHEAELSNSLDFDLFILCLASGNLLSERLHFSQHHHHCGVDVELSKDLFMTALPAWDSSILKII